MSERHVDDPFGPHQHHWADPISEEWEKESWLDDAANVRKLLWAFTILGGVLVLADLVFHRHVYHSWEELFAFYPIFGFVGIVVLVYGARALRSLVMRPEDYYRDGGD